MKFIYMMTYIVSTLVGRTYFRLWAHGTENIPRGPVIIVANHASNLDPPLLGATIRRECNFLAKRELFDIPVLGRLLPGMNVIPINREGVDRKALRRCADVLKAGKVLILYPEGTRTLDGTIQEGKSGAGMIAAQSEAVIVPAYIKGTFEAMGRGKKFPRPVKVNVYFGKPFKPEVDPSVPKREAYDNLSHRMMRSVAELREQVESKN